MGGRSPFPPRCHPNSALRSVLGGTVPPHLPAAILGSRHHPGLSDTPPPFQINGGAVKKIEAITLRSRPPYPRGSPTCRANTANEAGGPFPTSARHSRHRPSEAPPSLGDATLTPHPTATPHREGAAAALGIPSWRCPHCREGLSCSAAFPRGRARPWEAISPPISPPRPVLLPLLQQWLWPGWSVRCWRTPTPFWAPAEPRRTHCTHRAAAAPIGPVHVLDSAQPGRKLWSPLTFPRAISSPLCPASVLIKPSLAPCK